MHCIEKQHSQQKNQIFLSPIQKIDLPLHPLFAQMAESVDALVSNTNGVTPVPVRPRLWVPSK